MTLDNAGAARLMARLDEFAQFTDEPGRLTRLYLSPSYRARLRTPRRVDARSRPRA